MIRAHEVREVAGARQRLPDRRGGRCVDPERVRALCDRHLGVGADGVLALAPPDEPGFVARLRIFNPDGSEAELSGNGARQALLYLRERGWTSSDTYSIQTAAGEIRADDHRRAHLPRRHGPRDRCAATARSAACASSTSRSATRSRRSGSPTASELEALDLADARPADRAPRRASPTAPTSRSGPSSRPTASARGSSSAGWGRRCRPAPARAARRSPTCCAAATRRSPSSSTAASSRSTSTRRCTSTSTGWAVPVVRGRVELAWPAGR